MMQSTSDPLASTPEIPLSAGTTTREAPAGTEASGARLHRFASRMHRAIDAIEQRLGSRGASMAAARGKYGEGAREYRDKLREQIHARPLQSAGVAVGAGVILDRLFRRSPQVRVVKVPVQARPRWDPNGLTGRGAGRWMSAGTRPLQGVAQTGQQAAGKLATAATLGLAGTRAASAAMAQKARAMPLQMRLAMDRLLARSQEYGSVARSGMQAHPLVALGTIVGASGVLTALWMRRRGMADSSPYIAVDERGRGVAWQHDEPEGMSRDFTMMPSRPVMAGVLMVGLGALAGAMLSRR